VPNSAPEARGAGGKRIALRCKAGRLMAAAVATLFRAGCRLCLGGAEKKVHSALESIRHELWQGFPHSLRKWGILEPILLTRSLAGLAQV